MSSTGKKTKGKNFRSSEVNRMLDIVEDRLPFGAEQWSNVAALYNAQLPNGWPERDGESLKRKFLGLKNKRKPTGDPKCPPDVKRAKRVFCLIEARCAVTTLHDDDSEDAGTGEHPTREPDGVFGGNEGDAMSISNHVAVENGPVGHETIVDGDDSHFHSPAAPEIDAADTPATPSIDTVALVVGGDVGGDTPSTPARLSTPSKLVATPRAGLSPTELARLSRRLKKSRANTTSPGNPTGLLSQTAQRRIRLDSMLDKLASELPAAPSAGDSGLLSVFMMMDERQALRDASLRREREEREAAREDRERQFRLEMAQQQRDRDAQSQQLMLLVMSKLFGSNPPGKEDP